MDNVGKFIKKKNTQQTCYIIKEYNSSIISFSSIIPQDNSFRYEGHSLISFLPENGAPGDAHPRSLLHSVLFIILSSPLIYSMLRHRSALTKNVFLSLYKHMFFCYTIHKTGGSKYEVNQHGLQSKEFSDMHERRPKKLQYPRNFVRPAWKFF